MHPGRMRRPGVVASDGDGHEADVRIAAGQLVCALRGKHPVDLVALREFRIQRRMFEVPHQRCGIQKTNGGNTKPAV